MRFVQKFVSELAVEARDEVILLGLSGRDMAPVTPDILNPFEDGHLVELCAVSKGEYQCACSSAQLIISPAMQRLASGQLHAMVASII